MKPLPSLCLLAFLSACASTRAPVVGPLEGAREVPVTYSSRISGDSGPVGVSEPAPAAREAPLLVQIACTLVEVDLADARSMLGDGVRALCASREITEDALATLERDGGAERITAPTLVLFDGGRGDLQVVTQHAFVEAFEITESVDGTGGRALIGDPVVATVSEGVSVEARPSVLPDGGTVRLEFGLRTAELLDSIPETTARIPGVGAEVTVQQPLCFTQRVQASVDLGSESVLLIGGLPTRREGRVLVALVGARAAPPEAAAVVAGAR